MTRFLRNLLLLSALLAGCATERDLRRVVYRMGCNQGAPRPALVQAVDDALAESLPLDPEPRRVMARRLARFICDWLKKEAK